ncbi:MAG TPA: hypothetical protein VN452_07745 [Longilinea sp.]|nr:hypothetical protein [Longilinea sp.]
MSSPKYPNLQLQTDRTLGYRKLVTACILAVALLGFEIFNFSTTAYALDDLLGHLSFFGMRWSSVLAIAFCSIDFAGIARLFMPEIENRVGRELWFLFGAWLLAATMNAVLTWWGISMAVINRTLASSTIINPQILTHGIPVFVAIMVWVTRILLIGSFSLSVNPDQARAALTPVLPDGQRTINQPLIVRRKERSMPLLKTEPSLPRIRQPQPIFQQPEPEPLEMPEPVYIPMDAAFHSLSAGSQHKQDRPRRF